MSRIRDAGSMGSMSSTYESAKWYRCTTFLILFILSLWVNLAAFIRKERDSFFYDSFHCGKKDAAARSHTDEAFF